MKTLTAYLTRLFLVRWLLVLSGLALFVTTLDLVVYGDDAMAANGGEVTALFRYAVLRLPGFLSDLVAASALLAGLLTALRLIRHSEFVAIWNTGASQFQVMLALMPAAVLAGLTQFLLDDRLVPVTSAILHEWQVGEFATSRDVNVFGNYVWYHLGDDIVRASHSSTDASNVADLMIFKRDREGRLLSKLEARGAERQGGGWVLLDVTAYDVADNWMSQYDRLPWRGDLEADDLAVRSSHPGELSMLQLGSLSRQEGRGAWPRHLYRTWLQHRLAGFLTPMLMMLLAVALSQRYQRSGGLGMLFTVGIACGFAYFILNGVTLALGEVRLLPAFVAGWVPTLILACIAGGIAFHQEKHKAPRAEPGRPAA